MQPVTDNMVMVGRVLLWHAGVEQTEGLVVVHRRQRHSSGGTYLGDKKYCTN